MRTAAPPPFRIGTTSYIIPADIAPNARYLAGKVDDIELVLFEVDDGPNNLPTSETIAELAALAAAHGLTYTVHLPLDLRLADDGGENHASLIKARKVIERTRELSPFAYVLHADGRAIKNGATSAEHSRWLNQSVRALEIVGDWAGGPERLAVENLEGYPPDFLLPIFDRVAVSRCFDVGHMWLDGIDPLPHLRAALPRTRVIHIHGLAERDHKSLAHVPPEKLNPVLDLLRREYYRGVFTLEVFGEDDFITSKAAFQKGWEAIWAE